MHIDAATTSTSVSSNPIDAAIQAFIATEPAQNAITRMANRWGVEQFTPDSDCDQQQLDQICAALLSGGRNAADDKIASLYARNREDVLGRTDIEDDPSFANFLVGAAAALRSQFPHRNENELRWALVDAFKQEIENKALDIDKSKPIDAISRHARVMISYLPGCPDNVEDEAITGRHGLLHPQSIYPTQLDSAKACAGKTRPQLIFPATLAAFFSAINLSKRDFFAWCKNEKDINLLKGGEGSPDEMTRRADAWRNITWRTSKKRPSLLAPEQVFEAMENANGYCMPAITMHVSLRDLLNHDWSKPFHVRPGHHGFAWAGFINFIAGAGHDCKITIPFTLPPGRAGWIASDAVGYGYSDTFGIVPSYWDVDISDAT